MIIILMGVAGSGKTTLGKQLSLALHCPFYDGDDFHSPEARLKISRSEALTDEDRQPWLEAKHEKMECPKSSNHSGLFGLKAEVSGFFISRLCHQLGLPARG
jgi:gluconokinase